MKIKLSALKHIITEAIRSHERYMSQADAEELISDTDGDAVATFDIIDEETGEIYLKAGDSFNESPFNPDHVADERRAERDEMYARRVGMWDEFFKPDDDVDGDDYWDKLEREESTAREEYEKAVSEFAAQSRGFMEDYAASYGDEASDSDAAADAAPDVAMNFFSEHPNDWQRWAKALGMSKDGMRDAIADMVYEEMRKPLD